MSANYRLTNREKEILELLGKGMSNKKIGQELFISVNTVKYHVQNIYQKSGARNRTQAVAIMNKNQKP